MCGRIYGYCLYFIVCFFNYVFFELYGNELFGCECIVINGWVRVFESFLGMWSNGENFRGFFLDNLLSV